jgi:hypothetical protein
MTPRRTELLARALLVVLGVVVVAMVLVPASAQAAVSAVLRVANALRTRVGHGTLTLSDDFVLAAVVTGVTACLPALVAGAGRASRPEPLPVRRAALVSLLVAVVGAVALALVHAAPFTTFRSLVTAAAVGVALGTLGLAAHRTLRDAARSALRADGRSRRAAVALGAVYAALVGVIAFTGSPVDAGAQPWLLRTLERHRIGLPGWFDYAATEFSANVVFFVPLGVFVVLLLGARRWWVGAGTGFLLSVVIEVSQSLFLPARFGSVDDVVSNTCGAVIGALVGVVVVGRSGSLTSR